MGMLAPKKFSSQAEMKRLRSAIDIGPQFRRIGLGIVLGEIG
jgi:hypothetical protein